MKFQLQFKITRQRVYYSLKTILCVHSVQMDFLDRKDKCRTK